MTRSIQRGPKFRPFHVGAFDPGGTTGWARAWCLTKPEVMSDIHLEVGELGSKKELHHQELYELMSFWLTDQNPNRSPNKFPMLQLVSEPFEHRPMEADDKHRRMKIELISREYIGVMQLFSQQFGVPLYLGFNAGMAKDAIPNLKLEKMGWLQLPEYPMRHKNDALRQLVKYLMVHCHIHAPMTTTWRDDD